VTLDQQHKEELLQTQNEIQKETMKHIGREIHDNLGQKLTLSSLYLQQLVFENLAPELNERIEGVNTIINQSLFELRYLSKSLTDDTIERNSLSELIKAECERADGLHNCFISFQNGVPLQPKSYQTKSILLRIVQEFLQNSLKHSRCKRIEVTLTNTDSGLKLHLQDDGRGFDINTVQDRGIGLRNITKRIEMLQGIADLKSDAKGTRLTISIPL